MSEPIPMYLTCPSCSARHIDEGDFATKVHHTHSCQSCGLTWRPAVVPTVGVQFLPGLKNESRPQPSAPERPAEKCICDWGEPVTPRCPVHGSGSAARESDPACPTCGGSTTLGVCTYWRCFDARKAASATSEGTHGEAKEIQAKEATSSAAEEGNGGDSSVRGSAPVARPSSGGVPDPLPAVLPAGTKARIWSERANARVVIDVSGWKLMYDASGERPLYQEGPPPKPYVHAEDIIRAGIFPNPPAPLTGNDGTGGQQAGREPSDEDSEPLCAYGCERRLERGLDQSWHCPACMKAMPLDTVARAAFRRGRASLEKRIEAYERFVLELRKANLKPGADPVGVDWINACLDGLETELSAGGTKEAK